MIPNPRAMTRRSRDWALLFSLEILLLNGSFVWAAESIMFKVTDSSGNFCHLKFPAIKEETLHWARPVLKDPSEGDIVDFYGPCNYDPLGKEAILQQRIEYRQRMRREYRSD